MSHSLKAVRTDLNRFDGKGHGLPSGERTKPWNQWLFSLNPRPSARTALALILTLSASRAAAQQQMTLKQAVELAQKQGFAATAATATLDQARGREHAFSMRKLPQLSINATAPDVRKDIQPVGQPDGSTEFRMVQQTTANAGLTLSQVVPVTGATISVTSALQRYEREGGSSAQPATFTTNPVTFLIQQPILRPNMQKWNARLEDVALDAAERAYLEAREGVALTATNAFFDLYIAKAQLDNAISNVGRNDTLFTINKGRLEVGKIGENDLLQSELSLLRSRSQMENAQLDYQRAAAAFRLAVNLPGSAPIEVTTPDSIPAFSADTTLAVSEALRNRAQIKELEGQAIGARRDLSQARFGGGTASGLNGANVTASFGLNQTSTELGLAYRDPLESQRLSFGVSLPLLTWGARGADVQQARANQRRIEATSRQTREQVIQEAHFAALQITQARRNLEVSAKADTVAQKRYEVAYNRYVIGKITIDNLYIAQNEKDQAFNQYLTALRNYWQAYYRLRQQTLYDFEKKQPIR
jgi:outer membrane protein